MTILAAILKLLKEVIIADMFNYAS